MADERSNFHTTPELWAKLKSLARQMRHAPTPAENALWQRLRNRQVSGAKFRRQYAIERFIVDFVCREQRLIVEVDGEIHQYQLEYDSVRTQFLEAQGFRLIRFTNEMILEDLDSAIHEIETALNMKNSESHK